MSKKSGWPWRIGPLAHRAALGHLSYLVGREQDFIAARRAILERFPWIESSDAHHVSVLYRLLSGGMSGSNISAQVMNEVGRLAARYTYDQIPDGEYFMFQMVAAGHLARLWEFGGDPSFEWRPTVFIGPDQDFSEVLRHIERDLRMVWSQVAAARKERAWAEHFSEEDLERKVEWYFALKVKRRRLWRLVEEGYSESTIRRGVGQVQRLLGIPVRRGRPRKNGQNSRR